MLIGMLRRRRIFHTAEHVPPYPHFYIPCVLADYPRFRVSRAPRFSFADPLSDLDDGARFHLEPRGDLIPCFPFEALPALTIRC